MDIKEQIHSAQTLAANLAVIRSWLDQNPDLSPEAIAAVQAYADTAAQMLSTGEAFLAAGRAIEALDLEQETGL